MRIKELADLTGTTVRTIRYYHQLGLLAVPESGTTWRAYGFTHLTRLMRIRWLVDSGVPLAEVPHMLRPPGSMDEHVTVIEDLDAVLSSIDEKIETLTAQRARVAALLDRVTTRARLSPLPESAIRIYEALLERPLPPGMLEAISHERDLLELACYQNLMPPEVASLLDAVTEDDLDELVGLWHDCQLLAATAGARLTSPERDEVGVLVRRTASLATRIEPEATRRLLLRAGDLDRPGVRAAVNLAYPSPVYREFLRGFMSFVEDARLA